VTAKQRVLGAVVKHAVGSATDAVARTSSRIQQHSGTLFPIGYATVT